MLAGVQRALPWYMAVDVSYVGNHGYDRLGSFQGGSTVNLNAIDFGTAYLPQYQDTTRAPSAIPGATVLSTNLLRPYSGLGNINQNTPEFSDTYHSIPLSVNRRFRSGFSFSANYTGQLSFTGNTGLQKRLQHNADGSISIRADQEEYEELNKNLGGRTHWLSANAVWALPHVPQSFGRAVGLVLNDWRLAGILTAGSGQPFDLGFSYQGIGNTNLTGSPDYGARVIFTGDPDIDGQWVPSASGHTSWAARPTNRDGVPIDQSLPSSKWFRPSVRGRSYSVTIARVLFPLGRGYVFSSYDHVGDPLRFTVARYSAVRAISSRWTGGSPSRPAMLTVPSAVA